MRDDLSKRGVSGVLEMGFVLFPKVTSLLIPFSLFQVIGYQIISSILGQSNLL